MVSMSHSPSLSPSLSLVIGVKTSNVCHAWGKSRVSWLAIRMRMGWRQQTVVKCVWLGSNARWLVDSVNCELVSDINLSHIRDADLQRARKSCIYTGLKLMFTAADIRAAYDVLLVYLVRLDMHRFVAWPDGPRYIRIVKRSEFRHRRIALCFVNRSRRWNIKRF